MYVASTRSCSEHIAVQYELTLQQTKQEIRANAHDTRESL